MKTLITLVISLFVAASVSAKEVSLAEIMSKVETLDMIHIGDLSYDKVADNQAVVVNAVYKDVYINIRYNMLGVSKDIVNEMATEAIIRSYDSVGSSNLDELDANIKARFSGLCVDRRIVKCRYDRVYTDIIENN